MFKLPFEPKKTVFETISTKNALLKQFQRKNRLIKYF